MKVAAIILAAFAACAFANDVERLPRKEPVHRLTALRIICDTQEKHDFVRRYEKIRGFDFARIARDASEPIDVFVPASRLKSFVRALKANGIGYKVTISDVDELVREQHADNKMARSRDETGEFWSYFPDYNEIVSYLQNLAKTHSDTVELINYGQTYEGRDIIGIKLSSNSSSALAKPVMLIDGGIHAREWISPTTVLYAIKQLAENASNSYVYRDIDIYFIPCINPDGYAYTHQSENNRMWRKNRKPSSSYCTGTDINRNFDYDWAAIDDGCDETYGGPEAFSELESQALKKFVLDKKGLVKSYISFHSYGNYFLHPWGAKPQLPKNGPKLECAASKAASELFKLRGTEFTIGSSYNLLYAVYGGSKDWMLGTAGVDIAYTVELPSDEYGFLAPRSEILPVGQETFEAIKVFAQYTAGEICHDV